MLIRRRLGWQKGRFIQLFTRSSVDGIRSEASLSDARTSVSFTDSVFYAELAKRACIFFASAFVGSMFSGYLVILSAIAQLRLMLTTYSKRHYTGV